MKNKPTKILILGTVYSIILKDYSTDPLFEKRSICAYCDDVLKELVICNMKTYPTYESETKRYCELVEKETLRHEIIHAFLSESGLQESSTRSTRAWSKNEEMVDWIAIQFPKILNVYKMAKCL